MLPNVRVIMLPNVRVIMLPNVRVIMLPNVRVIMLPNVRVIPSAARDLGFCLNRGTAAASKHQGPSLRSDDTNKRGPDRVHLKLKARTLKLSPCPFLFLYPERLH